MTAIPFTLAPGANSDHDRIERLLDICFGLGRRAKTSYRLREGERAVDGLSFVARAGQVELAGAISYWRVFIGERAVPALLLGPLAVHPNLQGQGIGRASAMSPIMPASASAGSPTGGWSCRAMSIPTASSISSLSKGRSTTPWGWCCRRRG
jgi:hypothetical protein